MKFGFYADNELPLVGNTNYVTNSKGYRCPEFSPLPNGGKNVVVIGCSHTFGIGLEDHETWVSKFQNLLENKNLRFWNLGYPGASPDKCVRILYGTEKILFPKIIIMCWPNLARRERLDQSSIDITSNDHFLKMENQFTDKNNFLKCVFQVEKFAEYNQCKVFHCFAEETVKLEKVHCLYDVSLKNCWPEWDKHGTRELISKPSVARDGLHYGVEHHESFAKKLYSKFGLKLK